MKFKIEFNDSFSTYKFRIYRQEKRIFCSIWEEIGSYESEEKAMEALEIFKKYPKYFELDDSSNRK